MTHSSVCTALTAQFEGLETTAYQDQNGILTIGYGHTGDVREGDTCTKQQALDWLSSDLEVADAALNRLVHVALNQNEWDALCDFVFNIGQGNFENSTCLARLNAGDTQGAIDSICYWDNGEWHGWVIAAGKVDPGLVRRRQAEQALFNTMEA